MDTVDPLFGSRTSTSNGMLIWNHSDYLRLDTKGSSTRISIGERLTTGVNYNITFVFSNGTIKVYRNSTLDTEQTITTASLEMPLTIFTTTAQSNSIGNVYSVKVYNKALTEEEILQNYQADSTKFGL